MTFTPLSDNLWIPSQKNCVGFVANNESSQFLIPCSDVNRIPISNVIILHSLFVDYLVDALKTNSKTDNDYCVIKDLIMIMRVKHPDFSTVCL